MKRVYLLRHAKSAWDDPTLRDRDRPLAPRGRKAAKRMGRWARKHDVRPQLVVCSSAVRARETLQRMLPALGEPEVWVEVTLYAASADTLLERIGAFPDEVDDAMLVPRSRVRERAHGCARGARSRRAPLARRVGWIGDPQAVRGAARSLTSPR